MDGKPTRFDLLFVMWEKQCHKPPMTGVTIPPIYGDDWGIVYHCFTHIVDNLDLST